MLKTIKSKFILLSVIVIILSVGIPVGVLLNQFNKNFHDRSVILVGATIDMMIHDLNNFMMRGDEKNIQEIIQQIAENKTIDHIRVFNSDGKIKYSSHTDEIGENLNAVEPGHLEKGIQNILKRDVYLDQVTNVYKAIQPIEIEERCQTCHGESRIIAYLDVDTDLTKAEINFYTGSAHLVILGIMLILMLAIGFFVLFNQFINQPMNDFILALGEVEKGNLKLKLPVEGDDEFSILHYHYNAMVNKLKRNKDKIDEMHFDQLQRADKMVTLGELTASMAHDINNHSAIIMSRADFLLFEAENKKLLSETTDDLNVINDQIEKISKITSSILKHSKKLSKNFVNFDLVKAIDKSTILLEPLIKKRKVQLTKKFKIDSAEIFGDSNQIEQVVMNLIGNALDAIENSGEISVVIDKNNDDKITLAISDNGIGIDEKSLEKIFSPFYTNKAADKGTGLGLYIVQNICKNHNAKVECSSKLNKGTTFTITFLGDTSNNV